MDSTKHVKLSKGYGCFLNFLLQNINIPVINRLRKDKILPIVIKIMGKTTFLSSILYELHF